MTEQTEAQTIADLALKTERAALIEDRNGQTFMITAAGSSIRDITPPNMVQVLAPKIIQTNHVLQTADSLVNWAARFDSEHALLFADQGRNSIVAVIDYHRADNSADHCQHRATLTLPHSLEWKLWTGIDGKLMPQLEFARWLEENAADIIAPDAATVLEACRDLQALRKVDFKAAVRTNSDNESFEYSDDTATTTRGGLELPTRVQLSLPVYFGDAPVTQFAFLRWRLEEGKLLLGFKLHRAEHVRQAVFCQHVMAISDQADIPAVYADSPSV